MSYQISNGERPNDLGLKNIFLSSLECDTLYHIGLDNKNYDLARMFGDVKFVILGGSASRMKKFALYMKELLNIELPTGCDLVDLGEKAGRYSIFKIGPILSVSHGIGSPSLSVVLHELFKLIAYAKCKDVTFMRIGTCGLLGLPKGSLVITNKVYDSLLREHYERVCCGKVYQTNTEFNQEFVQEIKNFAYRTLKGINVACGGTMATNDFYEEQGRMDGATCRFTSEDRINFLTKLKSKNIVNIEMESVTFAGLCRESNVNFAIICVGLLDRLKQGDQVILTNEDYSLFTLNLFTLVGNFIKSKLDLPVKLA